MAGMAVRKLFFFFFFFFWLLAFGFWLLASLFMPVWYHKLTGQWKDEIQKIQNTGLRKILGAFRSAPIKAMQRDAEILPVSIRMKEIRDRFAIRAIRDVSPRNPVWKLANSSKLAKGDLEKLFARVKQMNGIDDDKY